jgi:hypothetical protein
MLLGSTGVLLCLAAFIGVWMVNHRIQQPVEHLLNQAFSLCDQAADGAGRIAGELDTSRDVVSDMQERLHNALQDALNLTDEAGSGPTACARDSGSGKPRTGTRRR